MKAEPYSQIDGALQPAPMFALAERNGMTIVFGTVIDGIPCALDDRQARSGMRLRLINAAVPAGTMDRHLPEKARRGIARVSAPLPNIDPFRIDHAMLVIALALLTIVLVVIVIAGAVAAVSSRLTGSDAWSLTLGTFSMPVLVAILSVYWSMTIDVDDPAPGAVLLGNAAIAGEAVPIALLASRLMLRWLSRRSSRTGAPPSPPA